MISLPVRVVVISEEACERQQLRQTLDGLPGVAIVAEVDLVCQMGKQAGDVSADCVVLDVDRYPMAGALSLVQARATFPGAHVIVLVRSMHPRLLHFMKASGASCCIDKDDPGRLEQLIRAVCA